MIDNSSSGSLGPQKTGSALSKDAMGGVLLIGATILALVFSNTALIALYNSVLQTKLTVGLGNFVIDKPLLLWINDGLMAVFFLLVGLELKREMISGELSDPKRAALPIFAAFGGLVLPALIYVAFNAGDAAALRGWAIPAATDIAFALGVLALLGSRVPVALKVFLLAVAIIDDLAAIIIIAVFYTSELSMTALLISAIGVGGLAALNIAGVTRLAPYILVGVVVWAFLLKSGVHATLAGVATALFIPNLKAKDAAETLLDKTEHELKPWVMFAIMPIFAFANAGVALWQLSVTDLFGTISLGIMFGLLVGKQLGILAMVWIAIRLGMAQLPTGVSWRHVHGAALLAGIGFTMSLFIGTLAFPDPDQAASVRVGVLVGSLLSGIAGYLVLRMAIAESDADALPVSSAATK